MCMCICEMCIRVYVYICMPGELLDKCEVLKMFKYDASIGCGMLDVNFEVLDVGRIHIQNSRTWNFEVLQNSRTCNFEVSDVMR